MTPAKRNVGGTPIFRRRHPEARRFLQPGEGSGVEGQRPAVLPLRARSFVAWTATQDDAMKFWAVPGASLRSVDRRGACPYVSFA